MKKRNSGIIGYQFLFLLLCLNISVLGSDKVVHICDDEAGWPPFVYNPVIDGEKDKTIIKGATVELIKEIFKEIGQEYTFEVIPWKRCILEVEKYAEKGNYEAFSNGGYSEERSKKYLTSLPLYYLSTGVFYSKKNFPNGIEINKIEDIKKYRFCGVHGYSYRSWNLKDSDISFRAKSGEAVLKMLSKGRCDVFTNGNVPIYAKVLSTGKSIIPDNVGSFLADNILAPSSFHIYISKGSPRGKELLEKINNAILKLRENGTYEKIYSKYYKKIGLEFKTGGLTPQ